MPSKQLSSFKFKSFWRRYVDIVVPVILDTVDSIMLKLHSVSLAQYDSENLWFWACDDSFQYFIHDFVDTLTSKVCHTISKYASIILDVEEVKCVLCAQYDLSLTTLIIGLRTKKILIILLMYSGCTTHSYQISS
jgi:hypothetical protein